MSSRSARWSAIKERVDVDPLAIAIAAVAGFAIVSNGVGDGPFQRLQDRIIERFATEKGDN